VGSAYSVTVTYTLSDNGTFLASNYSAPAPSNITNASITAKALTITAPTVTKVYDGTTAAGTVTLGTVTGNVESPTIGISGAASVYSNKNVGSAYSVTVTYTLSDNGTFLASNYSAPAPSNITNASITAKALTITASNGSKTYGQDYTVGSGSTAFTSIGLQNSETIGSITIASTGAVNNAAVGSYAIASSAAIGGTTFTASNYTILYADGILTVNPSTPIITITQPTCALQTGSLVLSGLPATGTWTLTRSSDSNQTTGTGTTITGLASGKYTFTVSIDDFTSEASEVEIYATTNTWNVIAGHGSWSNTLTNTQEITFDGDYNSTGDLSACSCQVTSGAVVINSGHTLKVTNAVTVSGGSLTFEDTASLVQKNENPTINSGNIIYKRTTSKLNNNYDFVYWSSPVAAQQIGLIWMASNWADTFYNYNPGTPGWARSYATTQMIAGKGYIARARYGQSGENNQQFTPEKKWPATFSGVPNNGTISVTDCVAGKYCLLGNPYPSAINADAFLGLEQNSTVLEGTLYFWTHNTAIDQNAYTSDDYASYNYTGSVATTARGNIVNGTPNDNNKPTGKIAAGQGFFAKAKATVNVTPSVIFNNDMRVAGTTLSDGTGVNQQFFRTSNAKAKTTNSIQKNRLWLNLSNTQGVFKQTLVGYVTDATNGYDSRFDGESMNGNTYTDFYSINENKNLTIQGRAVPFDENDTVPLGFKTKIAGSFTIDIDEVDGLLTNQAVYLEDKVTSTVSNLKNSNYTFTTDKGTFNDRFVLRYTDKTLSIEDTDQEDGISVFYANNYKTLIIKNKMLDSLVNSVALFSLTGQNTSNWDIKEKGQATIQIPIKNIASGIYIVKVKTTKGESSQKIIVN
jgi:hypothetical protein